MKSIYTLYIPVKDQEQADRLKAICLEYGLPYGNDYYFEFDSDYPHFGCYRGLFGLWLLDAISTESTEEYFINILKGIKNGEN